MWVVKGTQSRDLGFSDKTLTAVCETRQQVIDTIKSLKSKGMNVCLYKTEIISYTEEKTYKF